MRYSFVIPVYNRPDETDELLESLAQQTLRDFEVLVVEDGSQITCQQVVQKHAAQMPIKYFCKPNSGPGQTRNYGAERSQGEYLIFLDSLVTHSAGLTARILPLRRCRKPSATA